MSLVNMMETKLIKNFLKILGKWLRKVNIVVDS
jgi:hypothetical protein